MLKRIETRALLVRATPYREADLVAVFFTEAAGKVGAMVRGARTSRKRFGGALEPIHELQIVLEDRGGELAGLREAAIVVPRHGISSSLDAMEAAGAALRWVRHLCPPRTPEPRVWGELTSLFEALDARPNEDPRADVALAAFGLRLLAAVGYGLELERCARCGKPCPEGRAACVDGARGGVVCTACGGARTTMSGSMRRAAKELMNAPYSELRAMREEGRFILDLVDAVLAAHAELERA